MAFTIILQYNARIGVSIYCIDIRNYFRSIQEHDRRFVDCSRDTFSVERVSRNTRFNVLSISERQIYIT